MPEHCPDTPDDISGLPPASQEELRELLARIGQTWATHFEVMDVDGSPLHLLTIDDMNRHIDGLLAREGLHNPLNDLAHFAKSRPDALHNLMKEMPLWAKVWPASFLFGRYLRKCAPEGRSLLELGAGCGVTSLVASRYGFASIVISDIEEDALRFARANVLRNNLQGVCAVRRVDVTSTRLDARFDRIVAAELLYLDELHRPLLKFVQRHLAAGGQALLCTDVARRKKRFFKLAEKDFRVSEQMVGMRSLGADGREERRAYCIHILERP